MKHPKDPAKIAAMLRRLARDAAGPQRDLFGRGVAIASAKDALEAARSKAAQTPDILTITLTLTPKGEL